MSVSYSIKYFFWLHFFSQMRFLNWDIQNEFQDFLLLFDYSGHSSLDFFDSIRYFVYTLFTVFINFTFCIALLLNSLVLELNSKKLMFYFLIKLREFPSTCAFGFSAVEFDFPLSQWIWSQIHVLTKKQYYWVCQLVFTTFSQVGSIFLCTNQKQPSE